MSLCATAFLLLLAIVFGMSEGCLGNGNTQKFTYNFCSEESGDALGFGVLDDYRVGQNWLLDGLCMAVPDTPTFDAREYTVSVQLNNDVGSGKADYGHPGLVFNLIDSANYDFLFIRPHYRNLCYGYGYSVNGRIHWQYKHTGHCVQGAPRGNMWHDLRLHVIGRKSELYLNNNRIATFPHHFSNVARAGPSILKGFQNRAFFRRFLVKVNSQ